MRSHHEMLVLVEGFCDNFAKVVSRGLAEKSHLGEDVLSRIAAEVFDVVWIFWPNDSVPAIAGFSVSPAPLSDESRLVCKPDNFALAEMVEVWPLPTNLSDEIINGTKRRAMKLVIPEHKEDGAMTRCLA